MREIRRRNLTCSAGFLFSRPVVKAPVTPAEAPAVGWSPRTRPVPGTRPVETAAVTTAARWRAGTRSVPGNRSVETAAVASVAVTSASPRQVSLHF